jgi:hypothetical protein
MVQIESAQDRAGVVPGPPSMQLEKMAAVVGQQNPVLRRSQGQDLGIWDRKVGLPRVKGGQNVMSKTAKFDHYW